jgi:agmatine deiminase
MTGHVIQPAEWAPHQAVWIGFPSHADLWLEDLDQARAEVTAFAHAVHAGGRGERVILVAADDEAAAAARALAGNAAEVVVESFGDIWLRDTAAILLSDGSARDFRFNGWGGKYDLPGDDDVGLRLASRRGIVAERRDWILEGGAIDGDGTGLVVTTEQCLLNPNRNPGLSRAEIETRLRDDLGFGRVLWLGEGLANDHTDGHVDNLARFVQLAGVPAGPPSRRGSGGGCRLDPVAWSRAARRRDRAGELHELLHRQCRSGGAAIRRAQRRRRGRGDRRAVPGS